MASEVKNDLRIKLSDLNYLCSNASLACKFFSEMIETQQTDGQLWSIGMRALPQVKNLSLKICGSVVILSSYDAIASSQVCGSTRARAASGLAFFAPCVHYVFLWEWDCGGWMDQGMWSSGVLIQISKK